MIENNTTTINSKQESLEDLLIIKGISKVYKKDNKEYKVLEDINFKIKKGEMIGIVGESGSGKSTLLHILAGLVKPTKGEVYLEGKSLYEMNDHTLTRFRRRRMGFVFQFFNLISTQNVLENIVLPIHLDDGEIDDDYLNEIINLLFSRMNLRETSMLKVLKKLLIY